MIKQNKRKLASILFVLISFVCAAQGPPPPPPPPGLPVDGGALIVVLIFGIVYGIKKKLDLIKSQRANSGGIH